MATGVTQALASFSSGLRYTDLPDPVIDAVKLNILDTVGCALAGRRATGMTELIEAVAAENGQASIWGMRQRAAAADAALLNGTLAHALEFDDTHDEAVLHTGVTVIPAVAAAAECVPCSGQTFIAAVAAGIEVATRLAAATTAGPGLTGWLLTPLCGYFGAAAGAARIFGLNAKQTVNALGIAYAQTAGNGQATLDGAQTKRLQAGLAARGGLFSAQLARSGVTGAQRVFEGSRGYFTVYQRGEWDQQPLLTDLGRRFAVSELTLKTYPCCRWTHAAIETALELRKQGLTDPNQVESVIIEVNEQSYNSTGSDPKRRQRPGSTIEAQFSLPFLFALALLKGRVTLPDLSERSLNDPEILSLAARVWPEIRSPTAPDERRKISGAHTRVTLYDRSVMTTSAGSPTAAGFDARSEHLVHDKFRSCCEFAGIPRESAAGLIDQFSQLDQVGRVPGLTGNYLHTNSDSETHN